MSMTELLNPAKPHCLRLARIRADQAEQRRKREAEIREVAAKYTPDNIRERLAMLREQAIKAAEMDVFREHLRVARTERGYTGNADLPYVKAYWAATEACAAAIETAKFGGRAWIR